MKHVKADANKAVKETGLRDIAERRIGAVIASAGLSSRMGGFKPMLSLGDTTIIRKIIATFKAVGASPVVLVTGRDAKRLEAHVADMDVVCVLNERYSETGMFDSARIGLSYIQNECGRVFFTPADIPLFTAETLLAMLSSPSRLVKPAFGGAGGHPILIGQELIPKILGSSGEGGMKAALTACGVGVTYVDVPDKGVLIDCDTPEDYRRLTEICSKYSKRHFET